MWIITQAKQYIANLLDEDAQEVFSKGFWAAALLGAAAVLQYGFNFLIARFLGAEQAGNFFIAFTTISLLGKVSRVGLDQAAVRFSAPLYSQNKFNELTGLKSLTIKLTLATTGALAVVLFLAAPFLANNIFNNPEVANYLRISALTLPFFSFSFLFSELLRGLKNIRASIAVKYIFTYGIAIVVLALFFNIFKQFLSITAFGVGAVVAALAGWLLLGKHLPEAQAPAPFQLKKLLVTSLPLLLVATSSEIMRWADVLILGAFAQSDIVGIYSIALQVGLIISFALLAINTIAAPKFAELYHSGRLKEMAGIVRKITWFMTIAAIPVLIIFLTFPEFILSLFGKEFTAGASALVIIAIGQYINVAVGSVSYILAMTGHEKTVSKTIGVAATLNVILNLALIPTFGMVGAATATTVSLALNNLILFYWVQKKIGINIYYGKLLAEHD